MNWSNFNYLTSEYVKYRTLSSSRLYCPYSLLVPFPLVKIPQPDIIIVPDLILVMVAGNSIIVGLWVVTPTCSQRILELNSSFTHFEWTNIYFNTPTPFINKLIDLYLKQFVIIKWSMCQNNTIIKFIHRSTSLGSSIKMFTCIYWI